MLRKFTLLTVLSILIMNIPALADYDYATLLSLCQNSDLIVTAQVGDELRARFRDKSTDKNGNINEIIRGESIEVGIPLIIEKRLKGKFDSDTVLCYFSPDFDLPLPRDFKRGVTILVFLVKSNDTGDYSLTFNRTGIQRVIPNHKFSWEKNTAEILDILKIMDPEKRADKIADWIFASLGNYLTRHDAVRSINQRISFLGDSTTYADRLSIDQLKEIYESVLSAPNIWEPEVSLIRITSSVWDSRLLPALLAQLKKEYPGTIQNCIDIIQIMASIMGTDEALELAGEDQRMEGNPLRWTNRRNIIERFIKLAEKSIGKQ